MMIQKSKDKPLQFDANLEKIIIRTFEKHSKNVRKIGVEKPGKKKMHFDFGVLEMHLKNDKLKRKS